MQSELLDITIIGCLVFLFASTYRTRTSPMVRTWTVGWAFVLIHFTALLFHPSEASAQHLLEVVSLSGLIACGIIFLFAAGSARRTRTSRVAWPLVAGIAAFVFVCLQVAEVTSPPANFLPAAIFCFAWILYALSLTAASGLIRLCLVISSAGSFGWLCWAIADGRPDVAISALLFQLYLVVCLIYMAEFRRISGGAVTVVFGLFAWASVFPASMFCVHLGIIARISPEFWNVPKYFVAFGMVLILLEDEVSAANIASKHYRLLFEANPHPMWIYDPHTLAFTGVNDAAIAQYGFSREQFLSMSVTDLRATPDPGQPATLYRPEGLDLHRKQDGTLCCVDVATHQMESSGRDLAISLVQDVTERQKLHQSLLFQANHDRLTGLPNRASLEERLRDTINQARSHSRKSALLCLDVDRFKQINDTYGHSVGDICLQEVARRLSALTRGKDTAARVGGEEFALLLHHVTSLTQAQQLAGDILSALEAPIQAHDFSIELTASIGIAICPSDGADAATLWRNADCAMYRAKRAGGNQYLCMSPEIGSLASDANEMERCIKRSLREGGLQLRFQPLYDIHGELHSLEALVRLLDPERGLISPARFIPIAEERGLIVPLGDWVLNEVCARLAAWRRANLPRIRVAVNISPLQITRPDFAVHVAEVFARHQVDPHQLQIEITETAMMRNFSEACRQISLLSAQGIGFSVDDFGTGYSSFGQLDQLPVQCLKIDRTFIERICHHDGTHTIVRAMISMAHSLGLEVVAEGVETNHQWEALRKLNCDIVQGHLFSHPLPAEEVPWFLRHAPCPQPAIEQESRVA